MLRSKAKLTATIVLVLLMTSVTLTTMPVQAATNMRDSGSVYPLPSGVTPDVTMVTKAELSFNPNPIGVSQPLLVNVWLVPALITSRYFNGYTVTFTKPDGTTAIVGPFVSYRGDTTAWFHYTVDQVGTWKIKFNFPGGYFAAGNYSGEPGVFGGSGPFSIQKSVYYLPSSSPELTLTVQTDMVASWPPAPLPTDYWTRPISIENREWWPIAGNYPGTGYPGGNRPEWDALYPGTNPSWSAQYNFHPWVQGPNTAHIVWKRLGAVAGLVGGPAGIYSMTSGPGNPTLVYGGRAYQTVTKPTLQLVNGTYRTLPGSVAQCYDLRTGEIYYEIPTADGGVTPNIIAYSERGDPQMTQAESFYGPQIDLLSISGGRLMKINLWTGAVSLNVSIAPLTGSGGTYYKNEYVLGVNDLGPAAGAERYRLINWTTAGTTTNFTARIVSNTTYARSSLPTYIDWSTGIGVTSADVKGEATLSVDATILTAYSLQTGVMLWNQTVEPNYLSTFVADHGKIAFLHRDFGYFLAYDLRSGILAWQSEPMGYPSQSFGAYAIASAYGMLFRGAYDGYYAFDWETGKIVWHYEAPALAAFESPYVDANGTSIYPFNSGCTIADGKMYTYTTEHTPSTPSTRGWSLHCINITTGEGIWRISGSMSPGAIADGYLTASNSYDGYMYVFGKGKSATTVTASPKTIANGATVLIEGTVLDQSPAQPGTACVSKESMALQMEYLHKQMPIGGIWNNETIIGVPVNLLAMGSDGTTTDLGTVTTNGYYGTFSTAWTPPAEGTYEIVATFAADDSYGSSSAATALSIGPAQEPYPTSIPPEVQIDNTPTLYGILAAVIVAIVVGIAALLLALRKRP